MCDECLAIAQDLREAIADARTGSTRASGDMARAVQALRGGTEEDARRFEELCATPALRACAEPSSRVARAMSMKMWHETRTGHKVSLDIPG